MATRKNQLRIEARPHKPLAHSSTTQQMLVSPRWLITSVLIALVGAAACGWGALCLLFWQGSWQLLYHPTTAVVHVPSDSKAAFEPVEFAATETGQLRIQGWWIPAAQAGPASRFTVLYLHGANGNLGDSVDALASLHALGLNVLAFDYRGYGQSQSAHPNESRWLEDATWALNYLTQTRHTDPHAIVLAGKELGADLAVEVAAAHPDLAGVIVDSPIENPASVIFDDPRAHLVPAHLLVKDRYDVDADAGQLQVPSLWLLTSSVATNAGQPSAFSKVQAQRQLVKLNAGQNGADAIANWIAELSPR